MGESIELSVVVKSFDANDDHHGESSVDAMDTYWGLFDDPQREAALFLVGEALTNLLDRLDSWVPRSFVAESKNRLDIMISLDLVDIDNAVVLKALEVDSEMVQAMRRIQEMGAELDG